MAKNPDPYLLNSPIISVDIEGDGNIPSHPVEIGIVEYRGGHLTRQAQWLVNPGAPITWHASRVNKIYDHHVAKMPPIEQFANEIRGMLDRATIIGHGVRQDLKILRAAIGDFEPALIIDTHKLARATIPGQPYYKLQLLAEALQLSPPASTKSRGPHSALYDAALAAELFSYIQTVAPDGLAAYLKPTIPSRDLFSLA